MTGTIKQTEKSKSVVTKSVAPSELLKLTCVKEVAIEMHVSRYIWRKARRTELNMTFFLTKLKSFTQKPHLHLVRTKRSNRMIKPISTPKKRAAAMNVNAVAIKLDEPSSSELLTTTLLSSDSSPSSVEMDLLTVPKTGSMTFSLTVDS